jgi:outer membrane protein OmpA-like peptidoglycan-associated protein
MYARVLKSVSLALVLTFSTLIPVTLAAQDSPKPTKAAADDSASRWDIFLGYSYLAPKATINGFSYNSVNYGAIASVTGYFNRYVGMQFEGDEHILLPENGYISSSQPNDDFSGGSGGVIFRFPMANVTPFAHLLLGGEQVGSYYQADKWGTVLTMGGGLDYDTPLFNHHLAIRLVQADYQWTRLGFPQGSANFNIARLSAGLVYHIGTIAPPPPVTLACSASPTVVFPGEGVTATATAGDLDPKLNVIYTWTGSGVTGSGTTATVATDSLAPGTYTVRGEAKEGKPGKEGLKAGETADCSASFTIKPFDPPTISCVSSPGTINPGDKSTVTAIGLSPQNRPLTYRYSVVAGTISGNGSTATYDSTGAPTGAVDITCSVADDKGGAATNGATVTIAAPPPPPGPSPEQVRLEARLALHSVFFPTAQPRAEHPEGGLLASQQATLSSLAADFKNYVAFKPDAHLILSGHTDVRGSVEYNMALSDRRVARAKQFLVEQGIPEASIETRGLGKEQELTADEVKALVEQNPDLSAPEREKVLRQLNVIVLAQNRRVDVTLSTTGQQSVRLYPFNAADSLTLLDEKALATKKAAHKKVK